MIKLPKTIRTKLFLSFTGAILLLQVFFWAISSFGMEKILIFSRERNMTGLVTHYSEWVKVLGEEETFSRLAAASDGNLTYIDTASGTYYSTMPAMRGDRMMSVRGCSAFQVVSESLDMPVAGVKTYMVEDTNGVVAQVTVVGRLTADKFLVSERQLSVIKESTRLFSSYLGIAGISIVLMGALISQWLARRITKPIVEIEAQAVRIAKLEFETPNGIQSEDEIGSLAMAVNQISHSLEEKISQLSETNLLLKGEIEQERQLDMARRSFIANVSHELKTPISMIMGYADGLIHGIARTEAQKQQYYEVIVKESEHMTTLINQLLDLSAYQAGKHPYHMETVNVTDLVQYAIQRHQHLFAERGLTLKFDSKGEFAVHGDSQRLEMVLSNLLSNAYKYADEKAEVNLQLYAKKNQLVVELSNACSDFCQEDLSQLTISFFRGKNARERQAEGFGIGLGAIKDIVEMHAGTLDLLYEEGIFKARLEIPLELQSVLE